MKSPAFQFYPNDFLGGVVASYSLDEIGLYTVLLAFDWNLIGLPNDVEKLAKMSRVSVRKFRILWATVSENFTERDGRYFNPRLEIEREKQADNRAKKRGAAASRWNADAHADASQVECPSSTSSSTTAVETETTTPRKAAAVRVVDADDPRFAAVWAKYPRRAGGNSRAAAFRAWQARVAAGVDPAVVAAGTERYAAYVRAKGWEGTEYVKQGSTFYGPSAHWVEPWDAAPPARTSTIAPLVLQSDAAEAAWEAVLAMVPAWHRREITPDVHQALPAGTKRGISKIGGFKVLSETRAEQLTWLKKDFLAAYRATDAQTRVSA